ncbi:MAG: sigma-E factor negative regulatory protein, partial [Gammaproteobacteria bacterium]|nr:sigma-E factor negative regulatory protein [Gammaproteobacteria bacterium]
MSDEINSQLSAFVDDELAAEESELLVRRLCRDSGLRETAASYALIGDVVRDELAVAAAPDFARRVMMAVEGQTLPPADSPSEPKVHTARNWGFAAAASVMLAAIALMTLPERDPAEPELVADSVVNTVVNTRVSDEAPAVATVQNTEETEAPVAVAALGILPQANDSRAVRFDVPMTMPLNRHSAENQARLNNLLLRHLNETGAS